MFLSKQFRSRWRMALLGFLLLGLAVLLLPAAAQLGDAYDLSWFTVENGRSISGSTYTLNGSVGQPDASGVQTGGQFQLSGGFWHADQFNILTVQRAGTGSGSVSSINAGINCGSDCAEQYTVSTTVTLTATADQGSTFDGWSGACSGNNACVVTVNDTTHVTATFTTDPTVYLPIVIKE